MKKNIAVQLIALTLVLVFAAVSQTPKPAKHRVVMQLNVDGAASWGQLFGNIANVKTAFSPDGAQIEVVCYGKGLMLLLKTNAAYLDRLKREADAGVVFAACQNSMRLRNIKSEDLIPFATEVDSGVAELIRKQEAGWSYIREGE
jgi:uncharacterized protein